MNRSKSVTSRKIRWIGTFLSLAMLAYLLIQYGRELWQAFGQISLTSLIFCLLATLVSRIAVGSRWFALLRVSHQNVTWGQTQRITFAGLFASNFLPTTIGGDVIRLAGAVQARLDGAVVAASLIVDRLVGMFGMSLALPLGLPLLVQWFGGANGQRDQLSLQFFGSAIFLKWWESALLILRRIGQALRIWRHKPRTLLYALFFTALHQFCLYLTITWFLHALGETVPFWQIAGIWSFIYFVTLLPISINGYGIQELALTFFFVRVTGITESTALAVAILLRAIQMVASLPGAAFVPAIMAGDRPEQPYA